MPLHTKQEQREYQKKWIAERRRKWFSDKICAVCGTSENLELDHINPEHKVSHHIWSWSKNKRDAELIKCQVLCEKHHSEKSISEGHHTTHGTYQMYVRYKCKCSICRTWKRNENKKHRRIY